MRLERAMTSDLDGAVERGTLTVRGFHRVLRVAWTLSDLAGRTAPGRDDVAQAVELRHQGAAAA
jgi:magnesium chelatase family protein